MATLKELTALARSERTNFRDKVIGAILIKANNFVLLPSPTATQVAFVKQAFGVNNNTLAVEILNAVIASAAADDPDDIRNMSDASIQAAVGTAVDKIYGA